VDGLERELAGQALIVRLSVLSKLEQEVIGRHGVRDVPTFLIFDGQGHLLERQRGFPNKKRIKALITRTA